MGLSPVDRLISQGKVKVQKFGKVTSKGFFPRAIVVVGWVIHLVMILAKCDRRAIDNDYPLKK
jgi:hypothetical protein